MIRTGIYSIEKLKKSRLRDIFSKERNISIVLYKKLNGLCDNKLIEKYSEIILNRFNTDNNIIKRTYKNRFNEFDNLCTEVIKNQKFSECKVHDLSISDGRASIYFIRQLLNNGLNIEYCGSDLELVYYLFKKTNKSHSYVITDENKKIVEITRPPFVWNFARRESQIYFINNILKKFCYKKYNNLVAKDSLPVIEKIEIIDKDFNVIINEHKNFKIFNHNIFKAMPSEYDVIRAMNILHYGYFDSQQINLILHNIYKGLNPNGLFIEGSNESAGTMVEGSVFKKKQKGFDLVVSSVIPSRIIDDVMKFRL